MSMHHTDHQKKSGVDKVRDRLLVAIHMANIRGFVGPAFQLIVLQSITYPMGIVLFYSHVSFFFLSLIHI